MKSGVLVRVLGPVELCGIRGPSTVSGANAAALLSMLALQPGRVVRNESIIDALWPGSDLSRGQRSLISLVNRLNGLIVDHIGIVNAVRSVKGIGRSLQIEPSCVDLIDFELRVADAEGLAAAGMVEQAAHQLRQALEMWRGRPFGDSDLECFAGPLAHLEMVRLRAEDGLISASIGLGQGRSLLPLLDRRVEACTEDEMSAASYARALYQAGRSADALLAIRRCAEALADRGLESSRVLSDLEGAILTHDTGQISRTTPTTSLSTVPTLPLALALHRASPFVGREHELDVLRAGWRQAVQSSTPVVTVVRGTPGLGKTALAAEFAAEVGAAGARVVFGRGQRGVAAPMQVLFEIATSVEPSGDERQRKARGIVRSMLRDPDTAFESSVGELRCAARDLITGLGERPTLIVVDDLQWCDDATVEILNSLFDASGIAKLMIVVTERNHRPSRLTSSAVARLSLGRLSNHEVNEWAASVGADAMTGNISAAGGVPLLIGLAMERRGDWDRRLDALSSRARSVLTVAAVLGQRCSYERVCVAAETSVLDCLELLDECENVGLIRFTPGSTEVEFVHDIGREYVINSVRADHLSRIALVAIRRVGTEALGPFATLDLCRRAGGISESSVLVAATVDVARSLVQGCSFRAARGEIERTLSAGINDVERVPLLAPWARACLGVGDVDAAWTILADLRAAALANPTPMLLAETFELEMNFGTGSQAHPSVIDQLERLIGDELDQHPVLRDRLSRRLVLELLNVGDTKRASEIVDVLIERRDPSRPAQSADVLTLEHVVREFALDFDSLADVVDRARDLSAADRDPRERRAALQILAAESIRCGDTPAARTFVDQLSEAAAAAGEVHAMWWAEALRFMVSFSDGDLSDAATHAEAALHCGVERHVVSAREVWLSQRFLLSWSSGTLDSLDSLGSALRSDRRLDGPWLAVRAIVNVFEGRPEATADLDAMLDRLTEGPTTLLAPASWALAVEAAVQAARQDVLAAAFRRLSPFAGRSLGIGGVVDLGPTDRYLALCELGLGEHAAGLARLGRLRASPTLCPIWRDRVNVDIARATGGTGLTRDNRAWTWLLVDPNQIPGVRARSTSIRR